MVSGERDQLMEELRGESERVMREYGVEVVDVRVKKSTCRPRCPPRCTIA